MYKVGIGRNSLHNYKVREKPSILTLWGEN